MELPIAWTYLTKLTYRQCCGSGSRIRLFPSRIPDPNCLYPGSRILTKEFKYFNPKKIKKMVSTLKNMIRVVHPGSGCWLSTHPWSRGQKGTQSRIPDPDPQHCLRDKVDLPNRVNSPDRRHFREDLPNKVDFPHRMDLPNREDLPDRWDFRKNLPVPNKVDFHNKMDLLNRVDFRKDLPNKVDFPASTLPTTATRISMKSLSSARLRMRCCTDLRPPSPAFSRNLITEWIRR